MYIRNTNKFALGGIVMGAVFLGAASGSLLSSLKAGAAVTTTQTTTDSMGVTTTADTVDRVVTTAATQVDSDKGGHTGTNGVKEEVLTGANATKAKAAAEAAVPGGSIQRLETDAEGAAFEAHMTKSDNTRVTVKMDANFKVTGTEAGHGGGKN